ncbi:hypothetical protein GUJ93_ZPchr0010g10341 [Zizania palustris]|uniref:Uncharacterized protein n=1 Tax=Zizania palustris TaxID=103762 RepID=A0A8J5WDU1_ZIZPA|nr:hypothetical protein GUJ93_ZPchr0010g10341 [Zizania palustris]
MYLNDMMRAEVADEIEEQDMILQPRKAYIAFAARGRPPHHHAMDESVRIGDRRAASLRPGSPASPAPGYFKIEDARGRRQEGWLLQFWGPLFRFG